MSRGNDTDLVMVCTSDVSGQLRGKAMPRGAIERRRATGVGWTPTNVFITAFGPIAPSPWGAFGDLILRPDFSTEVDLRIPGTEVRESFVLGDVLHLDGTPWDCCVRSQLRTALRRLEAGFGLSLTASFEHEFFYDGVEAQPGLGYSLRAFRRQGGFGDRLMATLAAAGLEPDTFMPEYGPGQYEVTVGPKPGLRAADEAVLLRELTRAVARSFGARASFNPIRDPKGVGSGVHVHFSLTTAGGKPAMHDPAGPHGLSPQAGSFVAGILAFMPDFLALTAAGVTSYHRLTPHRWSAAFNNLGVQDREAGVRICPVFDAEAIGRQFHCEYRAADAIVSPYLLLATLVNAGLEGLRRALPAPRATEENLADWDAGRLAAAGVERLPQSFDAALDRLERSDIVRSWFGPTLMETFLKHKRFEAGMMAEFPPLEQCAQYEKVF